MASSGDMLAGWFSRLTRARALIIAALVSLSLLVIWQLHYTGVVPSFGAKNIPKPVSHLSPGGCAGAIPNIVHYVYVLKDGGTGSLFPYFTSLATINICSQEKDGPN